MVTASVKEARRPIPAMKIVDARPEGLVLAVEYFLSVVIVVHTVFILVRTIITVREGCACPDRGVEEFYALVVAVIGRIVVRV